MISREDFAFTIGYDGETAIVDGKAKASYHSLDRAGLAKAGLYRAAFASALWTDKDDELAAFAAIFNEKSGTSYTTADEFSRLFGVRKEAIDRIMVLK